MLLVVELEGVEVMVDMEMVEVELMVLVEVAVCVVVRRDLRIFEIYVKLT